MLSGLNKTAMKKQIELLAPGGNIDAIKAAIAAGADAVYCGLNRFNARNRAENILIEDLSGIINLAHRHDCKVFLTLNIIIVGNEIPALVTLLNELVNTEIDGIIVQDFGLFYLLSTYYQSLEIHASTQLTTHNKGQISFLKNLGANRVNLSRELNIREIESLTKTAHDQNILTEIFVHGSYCISFSGICYISSLHGGNSGNRGRCSQPCRDRYITTPAGMNFPLNLKDNSAYSDLTALSDAGVDSLKIEGRIKNTAYVYTVVKSWREQLQLFYGKSEKVPDKEALYKVFNRDFSNGYLTGNIHKEMFIDNPRDHSISHLSIVKAYASKREREKDEAALYDEKKYIAGMVNNRISTLNIEKIPLIIQVSGKADTHLIITVKTPAGSFKFRSDTRLAIAGTDHVNTDKNLNNDTLLKRFKALNNNDYYINRLDLYDLDAGLFLRFKELNAIKKSIMSRLTGTKKKIPPVKVPFLTKPSELKESPGLYVLIDSEQDLNLCNTSSADIFFQLPSLLKDDLSRFTDLFNKNRNLIPWFQSVIIGDDLTPAVEFLNRVKPEYIVTNNTGVAYEADLKGISWIAGPHLNSVNSFSLLCLKEKFGCSGAFISNEINKSQLKSIIRPENFKLFYSIYHPIQLITSRQCLFHQVSGCEKNRIDDECIKKCNKSAPITNEKKVKFCIEKSKGNYHCLYNGRNYLNTDIIRDLPGFFSGFSIDLRDIKTETRIDVDKSGLVKLFENLINGAPNSVAELKKKIHPSTNSQYKKGI